MQPAHSRSELTDSVNGELHERERRLELAPGTRDIDGHESPSNFLNGRDGQTAKVGSTDLREESLHEEGHSVQMSNDDQRVGRAMVVLQVVHGHPEEPGPQGPKPLKLLGNRERGADLARTTEEANKMLDLSGILLVVLEMSLHLLNLLERALESLKVLGSRLAGTVVLSRGGRSRGKGAALSDEVSKLGFVFPGVHCVDHRGGALHQLCPAAPVGGLPGEHERRSQDGVGRLSRKGANGFLQTLESNASMLICQATDEGAVGQESNMHGGEGKQSMHHVGGCGADSEESWDVASPEGEVIRIDGGQLVVQSGDVINQSEVFERIEMRHGSRIQTKAREREDSRPLPLGDGGFDLGRPHEVGLVGSGRSLSIGNLHIVVRASDLVLGAVATLREVLVTADVSAFAGVTALAGLGVAAARRTTTGTSHCESDKR